MQVLHDEYQYCCTITCDQHLDDRRIYSCHHVSYVRRCRIIHTQCPGKETGSIMAVTLTNLGNYSQFLARIILTSR